MTAEPPAAPAAPTWLPMLDEATVSHTLDVPDQGEPDFLSLPARPGVAVFEDARARPLLIATTADLRELARRRLNPDATGPARTDHRAVTRRILAFEVSSALEADVVYLTQARARTPETHRVVGERWRAWFVRVDPGEEFPRWSRTNLADVADLSTHALLGPVAQKDTAGRLIDLVTDAFDLCRDYSLLVQAPRARACAYKEMGRCPAPCDGSEPMPSFRLRTRRAVEAVSGGVVAMLARLEADMRRAAADNEFEAAAELRQQVRRLEALSKPAFAHVTDARRWRMALVLPGAHPNRARLLVLAGGRLGVVGEIEPGASAQALESAATAAIEAARTAPPLSAGPAQLDTLAALTRWLYAPRTRRRGAAVAINDQTTPGPLALELAAAAGTLRKPRAEAVPDQSIET